MNSSLSENIERPHLVFTSFSFKIIFTTNIHNCLQLLVKLDLINLQTAYNHETRFGRKKFCLQKEGMEGIKISRNSYFESS